MRAAEVRARAASRFPDGPAASPGFLLWHLTLAWQRAVAAALAPFELTHVQFVLLACAWWLDEHGRTPNQLELARQAGTDVKMTSQVVRRLEAKGLIERTVDTADARARRLRPTPDGAGRARRAIGAVEEVDARFFDGEADVMTPVLQRLVGVQGGPGGARLMRPMPAARRQLDGPRGRVTGVAAAKDLTTQEPRELDEQLEGYAWLPRMLDKARATLAGTAGRYQFGCPVDHTCLARLGIEPELVLDLAARHADDRDFLDALRAHHIPPAGDAWFDGQEVEDELQQTGQTGNYLRVRAREALPNTEGGRVFAGAEHGAGVSVVLVDAAPGQAQESHAHPVEEVVAIHGGAATFFLGKQQARIVRAGESCGSPPVSYTAGSRSPAAHCARSLRMAPPRSPPSRLERPHPPVWAARESS
jgi:DNA-binding MarR family transcriptional regulator/quercetin dioxygenase-like cupin family protein